MVIPGKIQEKSDRRRLGSRLSIFKMIITSKTSSDSKWQCKSSLIAPFAHCRTDKRLLINIYAAYCGGMEIIMNKKILSTRNMILCALFAALTAVFSQIVIPIPFTPIPVNLATLSVVLAGALLGAGAGTVSQLVYLLAGAAGLPVFTRLQGGFAVLAGPTGGYLIGYLAAAFITGLLLTKTKRTLVAYLLSMTVGILACYAFGTVWYMFLTHTPLPAALAQCVLPFLPGDCLKVIAGGVLSKSLYTPLSRLSPVQTNR